MKKPKNLQQIFRIMAFAVFSFLFSAMQVMAVNSNSLSTAMSTELDDEAIGNVTGQGSISGIVKDNAGLTVPGVSVFIKGTTNGTITNIDGVFNLTDVAEGDILVVSFVGMKTQEIVFANQTTIDIVLEEDTIGLNEVVAIGYTTRKKGEVTGSISTVNSEELSKTSSTDVVKSLAGKVPGLIISDRGGYPGSTSDVDMYIRGKSTLNNNSPLILIDGIVASNFSYLSPQDIESLNVLKDGAAAIYGARAANGVILITTKRGAVGKAKVSLSSSYTLTTFSNSPNQMNSEQFTTYANEIASRYGNTLPYTDSEIANYAAGTDPINYASTDWSDLTFASYAPVIRTSLSVSGGTDNVKYFVSGDYLDNEGMYTSGDLYYKQYQLRSNLDIKITENIKLGFDVNGRFGDKNETGVSESYIYKSIYTNEPTEVGIYPNGLPGWGGENGMNPYVMSSSESGYDETTSNNLRGKFSLDWKMDQLTQGLSFNGYVGVRKWDSDEKSWYTPWTVYSYSSSTDEYTASTGYSQDGTENILTQTYWKYNEVLINGTIHYNRTFGDHTVRGFIGYEQMTSDQSTYWVSRTGFPSDDIAELFAGDDDGQQASGSSAEWARVNYFGMASYDYDKKYFVDVTLRRDGSSKFADGKRFGTFPGVAVSWTLSKEKFMDFSKSWLNSLKIRSSWALMGNDSVDGFQYQTRYSYGGDTNTAEPNWYIFGTEGTKYNGYSSSDYAAANPDITWETADMKNVGVSFSLLDYKLSGDFNYFYQKREDILVTRSASVPDFAGLTLPDENLGKVNNFGYEVELHWKDKIGELSYNIGINYTQAKNKVVYMDEATDIADALKEEGHSMDSYIVYPTAGLFKNEAELNSTSVKKEGTVVGEPHYLDTDGDGEITSGDRIRTYSSATPEIQFGFSGGLNYKGFDLNFMFQGQAKAKTLVFFDQSGAKPDFVYKDRWTEDNQNGWYPRAFGQSDSYSGNQSGDVSDFQGADFYLRDASFVRLKQLELGYTFSKEKIKFGNLKVYIKGFNMLTMFSDIYKLGLDPEASGYYNFRNENYPSLKSYSLGFNLTF
jgi:TonB-linked SusC/RagA family outer membrane protein